MNRILSIAILLLTLLTAVEVKAQDMINETGYKCNDGGFEYISPIPCDFVAACKEECSSCEGFFDCDEIKSHREGCYYECPRCEQQMTVIEGLSHYCEPEDENHCVFCGMPLDQCICSGPIINGNGYSSGGGGTGGVGGGTVGGGTVGGGTVGGSSSNPWKVGDYLKPNGCQSFFKEQIMIMPQQETDADCVSTALAYSEMWANDYPLEKYEEVKETIEDNFYRKYKQELSSSGVGDSIIVDFITNYSGLVTGGLDINGIKGALDSGSSAVTILICGRNNPGLHFVSIIGYDCEGNYLYIDPQQSKLCKCTREELETYPTASGRNCIFAIY